MACNYPFETRVILITSVSPAVHRRRGWSCGSCWPSGSWPRSASASSGAHCPQSSGSLWPRTSARWSSQARPVAFKVSAIIAIAIIIYKSSLTRYYKFLFRIDPNVPLFCQRLELDDVKVPLVAVAEELPDSVRSLLQVGVVHKGTPGLLSGRPPLCGKCSASLTRTLAQEGN